MIAATDALTLLALLVFVSAGVVWMALRLEATLTDLFDLWMSL